MKGAVHLVPVPCVIDRGEIFTGIHLSRGRSRFTCTLAINKSWTRPATAKHSSKNTRVGDGNGGSIVAFNSTRRTLVRNAGDGDGNVVGDVNGGSIVAFNSTRRPLIRNAGVGDGNGGSIVAFNSMRRILIQNARAGDANGRSIVAFKATRRPSFPHIDTAKREAKYAPAKDPSKANSRSKLIATLPNHTRRPSFLRSDTKKQKAKYARVDDQKASYVRSSKVLTPCQIREGAFLSAQRHCKACTAQGPKSELKISAQRHNKADVKACAAQGPEMLNSRGGLHFSAATLQSVRQPKEQRSSSVGSSTI